MGLEIIARKELKKASLVLARDEYNSLKVLFQNKTQTVRLSGANTERNGLAVLKNMHKHLKDKLFYDDLTKRNSILLRQTETYFGI